MNIAVSTNLFPPVISGTASYSWDICRTLVELGQEVFLIIPRGLGVSNLDACGITEPARVLELPAWGVPPTNIMLGFKQLRSVHRWGSQALVEEFLRRHQIDFVYQQSHVFDTAFYTRRASRRLGIPRAVAAHTHISHTNRVADRLLKFLERCYLGRFHLTADDLWICVDRYMGQYCRARFPAMRQEEVFYGVAPFPECTDLEVVQEAAMYRSQHDPLIVSLGHVTGCRDRTDLMEAVQRVKATHPRVGLVIIGDTQVTYPIERAAALHLDDCVHFLGKRPRATIRPFLAAADMEAHWYNDGCTFGVATLESMATGVCCLSSAGEDCYGPDLFRAGTHYWQVKGGDPNDIAAVILALAADPGQRQSIAAQGAALVQQHMSWKAIGQRLIEVFTVELERHRNKGR